MCAVFLRFSERRAHSTKSFIGTHSTQHTAHTRTNTASNQIVARMRGWLGAHRVVIVAARHPTRHHRVAVIAAQDRASIIHDSCGWRFFYTNKFLFFSLAVPRFYLSFFLCVVHPVVSVAAVVVVVTSLPEHSLMLICVCSS